MAPIRPLAIFYDKFALYWFRDMEDSFGVAIDYVSSKVEEVAKKCEENKSIDLENASVLVRSYSSNT